MSTTGASETQPPSTARHRVFFIAGDPSGDIHGALVVRELRRRLPDVWCYGVCGPAMREAGVAQYVDSSGLSAIGVAQALPKVPGLFILYRTLRRLLHATPPSAIVLIDFPAFNMRVLRDMAPTGVPILYYFPPASWRRQRSAAHERLAEWATCVATPFAWSAEFINEAGGRAEWVGHPVLDRYAARPSEARARGVLSIPLPATPVAILPGSRPGELRYVLPLLLQAARLAQAEDETILPIVSQAPGASRKAIEEVCSRICPSAVITEDTQTLLSAARAAITKAGTITLDAAVCGLPMVVTYYGSHADRIQYLLAVKGRIRFIASPNILLDRTVVPEHWAKPALPRLLATEVLRLLHDEDARAACKAGMAEAVALLGTPGASVRTAEILLEMLGVGRSLAAGLAGAEDDEVGGEDPRAEE